MLMQKLSSYSGGEGSVLRGESTIKAAAGVAMTKSEQSIKVAVTTKTTKGTEAAKALDDAESAEADKEAESAKMKESPKAVKKAKGSETKEAVKVVNAECAKAEVTAKTDNEAESAEANKTAKADKEAAKMKETAMADKEEKTATVKEAAKADKEAESDKAKETPQTIEVAKVIGIADTTNSTETEAAEKILVSAHQMIESRPVGFHMFESESRDEWVPDKSVERCQRCNVKKMSKGSRHHCRACHKLVCQGCSEKKVFFQEQGEELRVCNICYRKCNCKEIWMLYENHEDEDIISFTKMLMVYCYDSNSVKFYEVKEEKEELKGEFQCGNTVKVHNIDKPWKLHCFVIKVNNLDQHIVAFSTKQLRDTWHNFIENTCSSSKAEWFEDVAAAEEIVFAGSVKIQQGESECDDWKKAFLVWTKNLVECYESFEVDKCYMSISTNTVTSIHLAIGNESIIEVDGESSLLFRFQLLSRKHNLQKVVADIKAQAAETKEEGDCISQKEDKHTPEFDVDVEQQKAELTQEKPVHQECKLGDPISKQAEKSTHELDIDALTSEQHQAFANFCAEFNLRLAELNESSVNTEYALDCLKKHNFKIEDALNEITKVTPLEAEKEEVTKKETVQVCKPEDCISQQEDELTSEPDVDTLTPEQQKVLSTFRTQANMVQAELCKSAEYALDCLKRHNFNLEDALKEIRQAAPLEVVKDHFGDENTAL